MKNEFEINVSLKGADEIIEKLKEIEKLLNDIENTKIEVTIV